MIGVQQHTRRKAILQHNTPTWECSCRLNGCGCRAFASASRMPLQPSGPARGDVDQRSWILAFFVVGVFELELSCVVVHSCEAPIPLEDHLPGPLTAHGTEV